MAATAPLQIFDPATGEHVADVAAATRDDVAAATARAREAQPSWAALPFAERGRMLRRLARAMRDDATLIETVVAETGKPRYEAEGIEIFYVLELTRALSGRLGRRALADERRAPLLFTYKRARLTHQPRGVVGVIGPWNWPILNNYADCVAPLLAGNAVLLKPSEWTPLSSLRIAELGRDVGLPEGVFQVLPGRGDVGQALCDEADMIFFTGSQATGRKIAARCGERLIPVVTELGGKSPMIVLADADLKRAARAAAWSAFANGGQVCIRTERVLVEEAVADEFVELCRTEVARLRTGGPPDTNDVGAITFAPQVAVLQAQIAEATRAGARVVTGGGPLEDRPGRFFRPTILDGVTPEMDVARHETFGPVLPVMRVRDAEEALATANALPVGLSGSVWSRDNARARALARRLNAGSVCVNDALVNYFIVEAPFGGMKDSGLGVRHGPEALRQFCRVETIVEDRPLLGWLGALIAAQLGFPYRARTLRLLRWVMRKFY